MVPRRTRAICQASPPETPNSLKPWGSDSIFVCILFFDMSSLCGDNAVKGLMSPLGQVFKLHNLNANNVPPLGTDSIQKKVFFIHICGYKDCPLVNNRCTDDFKDISSTNFQS